MATAPVLQTSLDSLPVRRGKVRDIYDLGEHLLLVSTDRISAFDFVLPNGIPDKGSVLTQISAFWFDLLKEPNHLLSTDIHQIVAALPEGIDIDRNQFAGRIHFHRAGHDLLGFDCQIPRAGPGDPPGRSIARF